MKKMHLKTTSAVFLATLSLAATSCARQGDATIRQAMDAYQRHSFEESKTLFEQALEEDTNYSKETIYNFIANILMAEGDFEEANVYLEKLLETKEDYRMLVQLGRNYRELGDNGKAEATYKRAIALNPAKGEAYASLGAVKIAEGKFGEAVENLAKAAELEPKIAVIHANLAVAHALGGDKSAAEEEFKKAEELKCENLEEFRERAGL